MTIDNTTRLDAPNLGDMKLTEISTAELRRILRATERNAGPDSVEARILRRELVKREQRLREKRRGSPKGGQA